MLHVSTHTENGTSLSAKNFSLISGTKNLISFLLLIIFFIPAPFIKAQDTFLGLTSNGGPAGRGTAFSIKSTGANFAITKAFADWGKNPNGDLLLNSDGNFYGMTFTGGTYTYGSIFSVTPAGVITILHQFNSTADGANPYGELIKGNDGNFYGMTSSGGSSGQGTIFKITPTGTFTVLRHLSSVDGSNPHGHLVLGTDGNFYGCTYRGGAFGYGTIFKMTSAGVLTVLRSLNNVPDGGYCYGSLVQGTDGFLYGITYQGGVVNGAGTIFKINTTGTTFTVLHNMVIGTDGGQSQGDLIQATDGKFYGMAYSGGTNFSGTIFKITSTGTFTLLRNLASTDGSGPYGALVQAKDGMLYGMCANGGDHSNGTTFKITTAGTFTKLFSFTSATDGGSPRGSLVQSTDGNLYGMTSTGGGSTFGSVFKITPTGTFTYLNGFNGGVSGNAPFESLMQSAVDNAYYGTTSGGGTFGYGTVFKICGGVTTVLHSFNNTVEGGTPQGSLVQASDNNFYGMTSSGGTSGNGTIFKITPAGIYTVLKHLSYTPDGGLPKGSLLLASDGIFYGMTSAGGTNGSGTIFKITTAGVYTVLKHLLSSTDGANPEGNLIEGSVGNFYGMTSTNGRIFKITSTGTFTVLHTLVTNTEGSAPLGSLLLAADGNFYGTTSAGGTNSNGTIFKITSAGTYTVLKQLLSASDGSAAKGNLIQGTDGNLYGITSAGGTNAAGTIFKITTGGAYTVLSHFNLTLDGGNSFGSLLKTINNLVANPQTVTLKEDTTKKITLTGSGGSPLVFTVSTTPKHGTVTGGGATKTYKPNKNYSGKDSFYFVVSVGCLSSAPAKVNITVTAVADTPVLAPVGNKTVVKNTTLTFTATATDPDKGQTLTFSLIGAPAGASINATTGVFTWTPATAGSYTFKIRVTDNGTPPLYDEEQITVTVTNTAKSTIAATGLNEKTTSFKITLYPNPVKNKLIITSNEPIDNAVISITDINGFVVKVEVPPAISKNNLYREIEISELTHGIYFLNLITDYGTHILKFIKM